MTGFSDLKQLARVRDILCSYRKLPFSGDRVPGDVLEWILAEVRNGRRLGRYDFIDVIKEEQRIGWQVKSTAEDTPVTWKRAKISNRNQMISASEKTLQGCKELGKAIIDFCNAAILRDFDRYEIDLIMYARLVLHPDGSATYFERQLVTRTSKQLFNPDDFEWKWAVERTATKKEQLSAFHGIHKQTNEKWWAWHGRGENQLHFSGERFWWPPDGNVNSIRFQLPDQRLTLNQFLSLFSK
jgi:hypothetical protein